MNVGLISKGRVLLCTFLIFLAGCGSQPADRSEGQSAQDIEAAEEAMVDFAAALEEMEPGALDSIVTSDFEIVEDTLVLNLDEFKDFIDRFASSGAQISGRKLSDFDTEVEGDVAWTRYRHRGLLTANGEERELEWIESAVLLRNEGGWRIDRLQSNPVHSER